MRGQSFAENPLYAKRVLSHCACVIEHGLCPLSSPYGLRRASPDPRFLLARVALCFALSFTAPVQIAENAPRSRPPAPKGSPLRPRPADPNERAAEAVPDLLGIGADAEKGAAASQEYLGWDQPPQRVARLLRRRRGKHG